MCIFHNPLTLWTPPNHQDVSGGMPVMLEGTELPLWALEIDPEREKAKFKAYTAGGVGWRGQARDPRLEPIV